MSDPTPATEAPIKPPMRFGRTRIAVSVFFALATVALCVFWFPTTQGTDAKIRSGFGTATCHVGMPADRLSHWYTPPETWLSEFRTNHRQGIKARVEGGKVAYVWFEYISKECSPYRGETDAGISSRSSIEDVLSKYGDPSYVWRSEQSDVGAYPGAIDLEIYYQEEGIAFRFLDNQLRSVVTSEPEPDYDYETLRVEGRESHIYIRESVVKKQGEELQLLAVRLELAAK